MAKIQTPEEALLALSEGLAHAARNPNIKHYKPHAKQRQFHSSKRKKKLYIGGNRSGKTTGGVVECIWRASCTHPFRPDLNAAGPTRGRVIAVDFTNGVEKIIFPQFKQWCPNSYLRGGSWDAAYDKTLRTLTFANGSTIEFMSYDQDLDKFAGTSRHWIHFDEEPPKSIYVENMARLIDTNGDFWFTMTPVEGMNWIYDDLYEPNINNPDSPIEIIEIDMRENPYLSEEAVKEFENSLDEDEKTARIAGKYVTVGGLIYKQFDPAIGGLHVLKEPIDDLREFARGKLLICGLDHGLNNPTAVLWATVDEQGFVTICYEHYKKEWSIDQHAAKIREVNKKLFGRDPDVYVADPSIQNRNAITMTSIHEEYIKFGIPFTLGNNDVEAGLIRVKRYLNPTVKPSKEHPMGQKPKIVISPQCQMLIWEKKRYRYKVYAQKKLREENAPYETPHKKDDHACDAERYIIMTRPDLMADPHKSHKDQVDDIMNELGDFRYSSTSDEFNIADPSDLKSHPMWQEFNSIPKSHQDDWAYDEHLGGLM